MLIDTCFSTLNSVISVKNLPNRVLSTQIAADLSSYPMAPNALLLTASILIFYLLRESRGLICIKSCLNPPLGARAEIPVMASPPEFSLAINAGAESMFRHWLILPAHCRRQLFDAPFLFLAAGRFFARLRGQLPPNLGTLGPLVTFGGRTRSGTGARQAAPAPTTSKADKLPTAPVCASSVPP